MQIKVRFFYQQILHKTPMLFYRFLSHFADFLLFHHLYEIPIYIFTFFAIMNVFIYVRKYKIFKERENTMQLYRQLQRTEIMKYLLVILGSAMYAAGVSYFITPLNLYAGGMMGTAQIIKTLLVDYLNVNVGSLDLTGIIYYLLNVPLLFLAWKINKIFFCKTVVSITTLSVLLTVFTISKPILDDTLTSCIIGGIICGIGIGFTLRAGGSGGGLDIFGVYATKHFRNFSVGKVNIAYNCFIYLICALMFNLPTAIYSILFTTVGATATDKIHAQNIMVQATIFTKVDGVTQLIIDKIHRGVTELDGHGAYTHEDVHVLITAVSKYEAHHLRQLVHEYDPHAFIMYNQLYSVEGNFIKKLQ